MTALLLIHVLNFHIPLNHGVGSIQQLVTEAHLIQDLCIMNLKENGQMNVRTLKLIQLLSVVICSKLIASKH